MLIEEFWRLFDCSGGPEACWPFKGGTNKEGYGMVRVGPVVVGAHVLAYETHHRRKVKPGLLVRHRCDNPPCGNPAHLETGTHTDNLNDQYFRDPAETASAAREVNPQRKAGVGQCGI